MDIQNLSDGADQFTANAYLVEGRALVDADGAPVILDRLADRDIDTVVITHSHYDHIDNLPALLDEHDPTVYAYNPENLPVDAEELEDGDTVSLGDFTFEVYHTPGHRDDHVCLYCPAERVLFSGDLIFPGGEVGRVDLEQGDIDRLTESVERIAELDVERMYAGHGDPVSDGANEQIQDSLALARQAQ